MESNVYDLPKVLKGQFDVVFASYGVLCWLPDLAEWSRIAASYVRPGGIFYIIDGHPLFSTFWDATGPTEMQIRHSYFYSPNPAPSADEGTYADATAILENRRTYEFEHPMGDIITSLIDAGLQIEFLHEFPYSSYEAVPGMKKAADGLYRLPPESPQVPLLFSIRATRL